ncbi:MAG TPA: rhomboid family intramembrane serine protease [Polyangia bacterium]|nr:rhomboid family intramembrane serine protease [Polyangia bacterium]
MGVETTSPDAPPPQQPPRPPRTSIVQTLREAPTTTALFAVCIIVFLVVRVVGGDTTSTATLIRFGANNQQLVWAGQWWRLVTSMFLHIGWLHLLCNVYFGFRICALAEKQLGWWRFLVLYLGSGLVGSAASVIGHDAISAGASGALFGVVGWLLAILRLRAGSWRAFTQNPAIRQQLIWIAAWFAIGVYAGFDNYAHGGGLLFGALYTWAVAAGAEPRKHRARMALAFAVGALIVAASLRPIPIVHAAPIALAKAAAAHDDPNTVLDLTEPLLAKPAYRDQALELRIRALLQLNRFDEAVARADDVVERHPTNAAAYRLRGLVRHVVGDQAGAGADFDKAVELDPSPSSNEAREWFRHESRP